MWSILFAAWGIIAGLFLVFIAVSYITSREVDREMSEERRYQARMRMVDELLSEIFSTSDDEDYANF
jgi:CHASE3 domain sensor protein